MATVVNARDVQIQSQTPRVATVSVAPNLVVDQTQVTGLGLVVDGTKMVYLQATTQVFQIAKSGSISPANTTLTAVVKNLTNAPTISVISGTISPAPSLDVNKQVVITPGAMTTDTATLRVSLTESGKTYTDDITIVKVREGTDALVGFLTNENTAITADYNGNPLSYSGASGTFKVFQGTTDITTLCTFALAPSGNPSSLTYTLGGTTGVYSITGGYPVGTDLTTLTLRATFGSATLDKIITISKTKAPTPSKVVTVNADKQTFTYSAAGTAYPTTQTISITAAGQNLAGSPSWTCTLYDASNASLGSGTLGGAANATTRTFDVANMGAAVYAKVTATWDSLSDTTTIVRLQDGTAGTNPITAFLTNESMVVAADNAGTVSSFSAAGGTMKVYEGIVDKTGNAAVTYSVQASSGVTISIASTGVYTVTAMSADSGTATLRAVYNGVTLDKNYAIAKSKAGAGGVTNVVGFLTNESMVVPTASDGSGGVFTSAGGTFKVFDGITDKTGNAAVTYSVQSSTGVTISIASTGIYTVTAMSADSGTATLRAVYGGVTLDKVYTIAKSKAGAAGSNGTNGTNGTNGAAAKGLQLTTTAQTFSYDYQGNAVPSSQSITLTANAQNLTGGSTPSWTSTLYDSSGASLGAHPLGGAANASTRSATQFNGNSAAYLVITVTWDGLSDTVTIAALKAGAPGAAGTNGTNGQRGSRTYYVALSGATNTYSDSLATSTVTADGGPVLNDTVVQYNNSQNFSQTKFWNGTAWVIVNAIVDGNLLVSGTVGTAALAAGAVIADRINVSTLTAIQASLGTAQIDANGYLRTAGATAYGTGAGIWMGYDSATTTYRFRVGNPAGNNMSWDGTTLNITGNLVGATGTFTGNLNVAGMQVGTVMGNFSGLLSTGGGKAAWLDNKPGFVLAQNTTYDDGLGHIGPYTLMELFGTSNRYIRWWHYNATGAGSLEIKTPTLYINDSSINIGNGKFTVDGSGNIVADTIDIKRRTVLQSGQVDPGDFVQGFTQTWVDNGEGAGMWSTDFVTAGESVTLEINQLFYTDIYDINSLNGTLNQPYYVQVWPADGALRGWSGTNGTQFTITAFAQVAPARSFSNTGQFPDDGRVSFRLTVVVRMISGSFNSFKLPPFNWTLYRI